MGERIGVFMDSLVFGAAPTIANEEVRNLRNIGLDASLLLIKRRIDRYEDRLRDFPVEVLEDQSAILSHAGLKIPGFSFFSTFHLLAPVLSPRFNIRYDLLVTHGTYTCFTARFLKKVKGIRYFAYIYDPISYILPHVYSETSLKHILPFLKVFGRRLDRIIMNASEAVILLSKFHLETTKILTNKPIHIVYPGTEVASKIPHERGSYILAVARWEKGKNPFFLLDVMKMLKQRGVRVALVMDGMWKPPSLRDEFLHRVKEYGLSGQINLVGPSQRDDLVRLYRGARALVHGTTEAFGMTGLEAAAQGAPIVFPKGSGVTDLFVDGVHGFFPNEGDLDGFSNAVSQLSLNEKSAWEMGNAAWSVAKKHTWNEHARALSEALGF